MSDKLDLTWTKGPNGTSGADLVDSKNFTNDALRKLNAEKKYSHFCGSTSSTVGMQFSLNGVSASVTGVSAGVSAMSIAVGGIDLVYTFLSAKARGLFHAAAVKEGKFSNTAAVTIGAKGTGVISSLGTHLLGIFSGVEFDGE